MTGRLKRHPLDPSRVLAQVTGPERGGTCLFSGTVRPDDGAVAIEYSAHEAMAEAELERIVADARDRWPEAVVAVEHRLGRVPVGEASVLVAGAAGHRQEAFAVCRYVIEELKVRLPVWKREEYADGTAQWVDNRGTKLEARSGEAPWGSTSH